MRKRLEKGICLLVSMLMVISSMPMGVLAQEVVDPSAAMVSSESAGTGSGETLGTDAVKMTQTTAAPGAATKEAQSPEQTAEPSDTLQTAESIETMATDNGYTFEIDADGDAAITAYTHTGTATILTVPETLTGSDSQQRTVTTIRAGAFNDKTTLKDLTEVVLPSSLTTIDSVSKIGTFAGCTSLKKVTISPNVTEMGPDIFYGLNGPITITGVEKSLADEYTAEYNNLVFAADSTFLYVKDFSTTAESGVNIGTAIPLTATAAGGTGTLTYQFYYDLVKLDKSKETKTIQDFSATSTFSFIPLSAGSYTFYVQVKDAAGKTYTKTIADFKVINTPVLSEFTPNKKSPQYISTNETNNPITLTAGVKSGTGTGSIQYEFSSQQGSVKTVLQPYSTVNTYSFKPDTSGLYTLYVTVKDEQGLTSTTTIDNYQILDYLKIDSFSIDKASPQELGTALTLAAKGVGGKTTCQYHFYYTLNGGEKKELQDFVPTSSVTFTPPETGEYTFSVEVMNASGAVADTQSKTMTIVDTPVVGSFTATTADNVPWYLDDTGHAITLAADNITGGSGSYSYEFSYTLGTGTVKKPIAAGDEKSITFDPKDVGISEAGTYTFYVDVKDKGASNSGTATKTVKNYVVYKALGGTLTTDKASPQNKETTVKLTAAGSGGKAPYTYEFSYITPDNTVIPLGKDSSTKTASATLNDDGNYTLQVIITDANKVHKTVTIPYTIRDNPIITGLKTDRDTETAHYAGDAVVVTPTVEGGNGPYTYVFTYKMGTKVMATSTKTAVSASDAVTETFTPPGAGTYTFEVKVTDKDGLSSSKSITNYKVLAALTAKTLKTDKVSGQNVGTAIKLTATASGGKTPYSYCFYYTLDGGVKKDLSGGTFTGAYGTASTAVFTPTAAGTYALCVDIKDANGTKVATGTVANYRVINAPVIKDFSGVKSAGETGTAVYYSGDTLSLTAKTADKTGEGNLTYRFYYKLGSKEFPIETVTKTNRVDSEEATVDFVLPAAGTYNLFVEVSDGTSKDVANLASYKVLPAVTAKAVTVSKLTGVKAGDTVKLTAAATGGKTGYTYQFYYTTAGSTGYTAIGNSVTTKTIDFKLPEKVDATYTFYVKVTDANKVESGNPTTKEAQLKASESAKLNVVNPPVIGSTTYAKTAGTAGTTFYAGDILHLTATTTAGTGVGQLTYRFYYKLGTKEVNIGAAGTLASGAASAELPQDFVLPAAGTYNIFVEIKDEAGSTAAKQIASCKALAAVAVKTVKASKITGVNVGDTVKITAAGTGGKTPYKYQLYYYSAEGLTKIGDPSSTATINFTPSTAGTYRLYVGITDANGVTSSNTDKVYTEVTVGNPPVISSLDVSPAKGGAVYEGEPVALKANIKAGTGMAANLSYTFFYKLGSVTTTIDPASVSGNTATFKPEKAGSYTLGVTVSDGTTEVTKTITSYPVLTKVAVKNLVADKKSGQNIGTTIKLTATGTGGKAPYTYEFYSINQEGEPKTFQNYSTSKTANFKPISAAEAGCYTLHVRIKDANGNVCTNDKEVFIQDYEIVDYPIIKDFSTSLASGQYVDTEIGLTATVTGGTTPYTYVFSYKLGTTAPVTLDSTDNKAIFKPTAAGTYTLSVAVTDKYGKPVPAATKDIKSFKVIDKPSVKSFNAGTKTSVVKGSKVTLKAVAAGGLSPYTYEFSYKKDGDTEKTVIRNYSTTSTTSSYVWIVPADTTGTVTYTLYVGIKDKLATEATKEMTLTATD